MAHQYFREVLIPENEHSRLHVHLMFHRPGVKVDTFVAEMIRRWLKVEEERIAYEENGRGKPGYQWKNVFLPDGTTLRSRRGSTTIYARVISDAIVYDDRPSSPSAFANSLAPGRSAWRFVWLRFPGKDFWVRAADWRARQEKEQARHALTNAVADEAIQSII